MLWQFSLSGTDGIYQNANNGHSESVTSFTDFFSLFLSNILSFTLSLGVFESFVSLSYIELMALIKYHGPCHRLSTNILICSISSILIVSVMIQSE